MKAPLIGIITFLVIFSCKPPERIKPLNLKIDTASVFIVNEGGFNYGNASLTYYQPDTDSLSQDIFLAKNGIKVGDVAQSFTKINDMYFLVVNNSGKIWVLDKNLKVKTSINNLVSPRYIQQVNDKKAYVTDLYSNKIAIIDLINLQATGSINLNGWSEQMLMHNSLIWVCKPDGKFMYCIDSNNDTIKDSIEVAYGANSIVLDKNQHIWLSCTGKDKEPAQLICIDPINKSILSQLKAKTASDFSQKLCIGKTLDTLYWLDGGVKMCGIDAKTYPDAYLVPSKGRNFYALGLKEYLYVGDAKDYVQNGELYIFKTNGSPVKSFEVGIIPGNFYFN